MNIDSQLVHNALFDIRTYEVAHNKTISVPNLIKLLHEAAMQNVIELKVSVWDLAPRHLSWVLMRKKIHICRLPHLQESIRVMTYPAGFEKFFTYRDYRVYDSLNLLIAHASSTWLLMDTRTRRLVHIPEDIRAFEMPDRAACLPKPEGKIPRIKIADRSKTYRVDWYDLDFNQHLNNVYYLQWMLETLDDEVLQNQSLTHFDIEYRAESQWKDQLISEIQCMDKSHYLHRLIRCEDQKVLAYAQSFWQ